ncbi:alpha-L-arabinofuranosidase C-terminal domain-containing protein [Haliscomenobacter sp.]|uniref:alpha-L-arabinofuranosidase C-terminal domain-containing protein n=1 Tax=Haliscomenobacter sp. TaxID=2717303 RepID=UPI003BA84FC1
MRNTLFLLCCLFASMGRAQVPGDLVFTIDANKPGAPIQPTMYGVFFEDINFGADGGLYGELIKNRSFEFAQPLVGWIPFGRVTVADSKPAFSRNPHYAQISYSGQLTGSGLENEGFRGIGLNKGEKYLYTVYSRTAESKAMKLRLELVNSNNEIIGSTETEVKSADWQKLTGSIEPKSSDMKAHFRLTLLTQGKVDVDHISLFPEKTWKNRPGGLRADLVQALAEMHPGVIRFPGGCVVEGNNLGTRYNWKNTVGAPENRPFNENRWNYEFKHRLTPDYYQSYGLGFFEYFQLCEDLGAEPLPVLSCGLACQFACKDDHCRVPLDSLGSYVQDALDLIEFANGPATSKWGKVRADMGHPAPFNMKLIAIGNEQWGPEYTERLPIFVKALREKHPKIQIIGSSGPFPDGKEFDYLWPEMRKIGADLVDEHYYRSPQWFYTQAARYDTYDRKGPRVFAGEYAAHTTSRDNSFESALAEAAFMTGLERNADLVHMTSYAPLFAHYEAWQWRPNLIWYNNQQVVLTPDYYVQQLYATYKGTHTLPIQMNGKNITGQEGLYASAVVDAKTNEVVLKIANTGIVPQKIKLKLAGLSNVARSATVLELKSDRLSLVNTPNAPEAIVPREKTINFKDNEPEVTLDALTFWVLRVKR